MKEKIVRSSGGQCLNIAIDALVKEGWIISGNPYKETDKHGKINFCVKMIRDEPNNEVQITY